MEKLTPVLFVESIEPCLDFWVTRLGFAKTVEVPHGNGLGFVALEKGAVEVMLQSRASLAADAPALAAKGPLSATAVGFYVEVLDLAPIRAAVRPDEIAFPERSTFYGMREIGVRAPGGFNVTFAQRL